MSHRPFTAVLAAAVLATAAAGSAGAIPTYPDDWTAEHGLPGGSFGVGAAENPRAATFSAEFNYTTADLQVTVVPVDESGEPTGEPVVVPFTDLGDASGVLSILETRRLLGEAGTAPVRYELSAGGVQVASLTLAEDADLSDEIGAPVVGAGNAHSIEWQFLPASSTARSNVTEAEGVTGWLPGLGWYPYGDVTQPSEVVYELDIIDAPEHGTLTLVQDCEYPEQKGWRYVPEAGYEGADTTTFAISVGGVVKTRTLHLTVGPDAGAEEQARREALLAEAGYVPFDPADVVGPDWEACPVEGAAPAPVEEDDDTTAPTPAPVEESDDTDGHTVPDSVETGPRAGAWPFAAAAAGLTGLVTLLTGRRRARA